MSDERNGMARPTFAGFPRPSPVLDALRRIVRLSGEFERQLGRVLAVNSTDLTAMEQLLESGPLTPGELARRLRISTAAATLVVDRLAASGHAVRQPHGEDRRKVVVVPTEASAGRAAAELLPLVRGVAELLQDLSPEETETVQRFLGRVAEVYEDVLENPST